MLVAPMQGTHAVVIYVTHVLEGRVKSAALSVVAISFLAMEPEYFAINTEARAKMSLDSARILVQVIQGPQYLVAEIVIIIISS